MASLQLAGGSVSPGSQRNVQYAHTPLRSSASQLGGFATLTHPSCDKDVRFTPRPLWPSASWFNYSSMMQDLSKFDINLKFKRVINAIKGNKNTNIIILCIADKFNLIRATLTGM